MKTIAESMENDGVKVLMIVNLDSGSGAAIEKEAAGKGITTIDYDRLTLGGAAALYVSFDGVAVGEEQGKALTSARRSPERAPSTTSTSTARRPTTTRPCSSRATTACSPSKAGWKKLDDQSIADWDNQKAGTTFASMLQAHPNLNAVMVANDGMANAVIGALKTQHLNGKVAVSGQDATAQGLQHIIDGDQCFTIYKPSAEEAIPAVDAIAQIVNGQVPQHDRDR